jgi:hypothetical protein
VYGGDESDWLDDRIVAVPWWQVMQGGVPANPYY